MQSLQILYSYNIEFPFISLNIKIFLDVRTQVGFTEDKEVKKLNL